MRPAAAILFLAAMTSALVLRLSNSAQPLHGVQSFYRYLPNYRTPLIINVEPNGTKAYSASVETHDAQSGQQIAPERVRQLSILIAGDTGLNGSFQPVHAGFGLKHGNRIAFGDATKDVAPLIDSDINFANLETVVTDRNDLAPSLKMFGFRTHPEGLKELMRIGFNVFSTANNHSMDYGLEGARETMKHLNAAGVAHVGLGLQRNTAALPVVLERNGFRVAFAAMGIGGYGFDSGPGQLSGTERDFEDVTSNLRSSTADYRVLSVHYGTEFEVYTSASDRIRFARAVAKGADMIVGHHQHVVAGIELVQGKPIFYGLGNFLHWGTQDMGRHDMCHDYGLVARVHLSAERTEGLSVKAIEAFPVTQMHLKTRRLPPEASSERIHALNHLNRRLGPNALQFSISEDGSGLYCRPGSEHLSGSIGERCAKIESVQAPTEALAAKIADACSRKVVRIAESDNATPAGTFAGMGGPTSLSASVAR